MWTVNDLYLKITHKLVLYLAAKETNILYLAMFQSFFVLFISDCVPCTLQGSLHFFARHSIKTRSHSEHTIISPQWKESQKLNRVKTRHLLPALWDSLSPTLHTVHPLSSSDFYSNVCSTLEPPWTFPILLKTAYFPFYPSFALLYLK